MRLCGLVEQSSKAVSGDLRKWAFSHDVTLKLFDFFMDWNESDQHRSMKLVLDLVVQLIKRNPQQDSALATKQFLLDNLISIVTGRSTKPVAKSAIKTLDHFLTKGVFTLDEIRSCYESHKPGHADMDDTEVWRLFMLDLFRWLRLHFVCPTAGKFIVSVYRCWHPGGDAETSGPSMRTWYKWLLHFATEEPSLLESIKNYIFLPLLKAERSEALRFLGMMNEDKAVAGAASLDLDMPALLQLAALEAGKKVGLVEEPGKDLPDEGSIYRSLTVIQLLEATSIRIPNRSPSKRRHWIGFWRILRMKCAPWQCLCSSPRLPPQDPTHLRLWSCCGSISARSSPTPTPSSAWILRARFGTCSSVSVAPFTS